MSDWRAFFGRLAGREGEAIGTSDWFTLDQLATDIYAALIADLDPMHNDPAWPGVAQWGGTIVVGTHGLCLLPALLGRHGFPTACPGEVEFRPLRLHRARFVASLNVGKRARDRAVLRELVAEGDSAFRVTTEHTIEREGEEKPFMGAVLECAYRLRDAPT
jgi:acyl dehydratase